MLIDAPHMSPEEQDYINSLPVDTRPKAIFRLQHFREQEMARFIQFLRARNV
jgi:hypothetical protein